MTASIDPLRISILVSFLLGAVLTGQITRNPEIPLKNWPAPLYWQPAPSETEPSGMRSAIRTATPHASATSSPLVFIAMTPCRVVDTRASQMFPDPFGQPSLMPGAARTFTIQTSTRCSIPASSQAYSFNVTVVPPGPLGYLTIYPHGQPTPNAVTLDDVPGQIVNNATIVPAGTPNGAVDMVVNANTDVVLDINGYYAPLNATDLGNANTAVGVNALAGNTSGMYNTASGWGALASNTIGSSNTASGVAALFFNTTGINNTANGYNALVSNTTGNYNTASGFQALGNNTTGNHNTASGYLALNRNTTGLGNTANGTGALFGNTAGIYNTASGGSALSQNTTGNYNIAVGDGAGVTIRTGSYNIDIGNNGTESDGTASNSGVIRIGDALFQTSFFAAGVRGVRTTNNDAMPVLIDSAGQLGTMSSSRRYKEDIQDMTDASSGLLRLRPVTFHYQKPYADGSKPRDYGLVAEEVAEVYPDLVVKDKEGQAETVQYHKLIPMLLNELQKDHETIQLLQARIEALEQGRGENRSLTVAAR